VVDEHTLDQVLAWYERIEHEVLEFSESVPLTAENETLKVPRLISCLMDACGLLDSVFRDRISNDPEMVNGKSTAKKDCTIKDYAYLHSSTLDLPNTRSVMLVSPPRYRCPFAPWKNLTEEYLPLPWWQTYNSLKHDLLSNIREGTLGNELDALCALHQVLARSTSLTPILMRRGWFSPGELGINDILSFAKSNGTTHHKFIIMTKLFAVPDGFRSTGEYPSQFPEKIEELQPRDYVYRPQFAEFLGKGY
jgi:hypothetical protein